MGSPSSSDRAPRFTHDESGLPTARKLCYSLATEEPKVMDKSIANVEGNALHVEPSPRANSANPVMQDGPSYMTDQEVERAAEKVFRLHARLFEELAK